MKERFEAIVSGRVQMVMYRDFTCRTARRLGLVGEVKNLPDGTVRVIAEGARPALETFLARLAKGSLLANVRNVSVEWKPPTDAYRTFEIRYR